jgi:hypothetical protein
VENGVGCVSSEAGACVDNDELLIGILSSNEEVDE